MSFEQSSIGTYGKNVVSQKHIKRDCSQSVEQWRTVIEFGQDLCDALETAVSSLIYKCICWSITGHIKSIILHPRLFSQDIVPDISHSMTKSKREHVQNEKKHESMIVSKENKQIED